MAYEEYVSLTQQSSAETGNFNYEFSLILKNAYVWINEEGKVISIKWC